MEHVVSKLSCKSFGERLKQETLMPLIFPASDLVTDSCCCE
ncbi:unnamed protein product [Brassica rapa subsp. narinosa]